MDRFDYYRPAGERRCPVCQRVLIQWQGKDGPCSLFIWGEGSAAPIDQDLPEEVRAELDVLKTQRLPPSFTIYSHDCPDHQPIDADCLAPDGIWSSTTLRPYLGRPYSSNRQRVPLRGFLNWANELRAAVDQRNVRIEVTVCEPTSNPAVRLDVDTADKVARITFWSSGDYHAEILDSPSGEQVYSEHGAAVAGESLTRRFRSWFEQLALPAS